MPMAFGTLRMRFGTQAYGVLDFMREVQNRTFGVRNAKFGVLDSAFGVLNSDMRGSERHARGSELRGWRSGLDV